MRTDQYILRDGEPVPEPDLMAWGRWRQSNDGTIGKTMVGEVLISTIFLGLDRAWDGGTPILFETMVFDGELDAEMDRYCTYAEALAGHERMVNRVLVAEGRVAPESGELISAPVACPN